MSTRAYARGDRQSAREFTGKVSKWSLEKVAIDRSEKSFITAWVKKEDYDDEDEDDAEKKRSEREVVGRRSYVNTE